MIKWTKLYQTQPRLYMKKKTLQFTFLLTLIAALAAGLSFYWHYEKNYPSTDDAYVQANIITIAPRITGQVVNVYVQDQQFVIAGQALFDLDPTPFLVELNKAIAHVDETIQQINAAQSAVKTAKSLLTERKAQLTNIIKDSRRTFKLVSERLYSVAEGDRARSNLDVAEAEVAAAKSQLAEAQQKLGQLGDANASLRAAKATVAQAQLNLTYTHVIAPKNGYISNFTLRTGAPVSAYQDIFSIVEKEAWWAIANFKETDLEHIHIGQSATIKIDMYPQVIFKGTVTSISAGSGSSFSLLPPENATGNWVKVTQRFPVRINILDRYPNFPLRVGASCEVTIDARQKAQ